MRKKKEKRWNETENRGKQSNGMKRTEKKTNINMRREKEREREERESGLEK